ncbi:hypothetical protein N657DRAFT_644539 [Parathielavia appendiculata]|uniref:RING-type E3 ubiquitin transferase n=1 Tax=Parathielavia appendiculata TaxID=2587402 RepID=A0AAN6U1N0_9PEZI|nr:hypothetical protein N657DRAFT_644539 [Parathielavia appendiculata]
MDAEAGVDCSEEIQAQVLQTTLAEIKTSRRDPPGSSEPHECCVICLDSIADTAAAFPCGHSHFDFLCLVSWLQEHPNCPLCKANVYKVRYADPQKGEAIYRVPNAPRPRHSTARDERGAVQNRQTPLDRASRRRFSSQNGLLRGTGRRCPPPPPTPDEAIQRRRHIYRHQLYSLHIGSNRISQYRPPPTPVQFASTPHLVSRARLWIRRELQVFSFLCDPEPITTTEKQQQQDQEEDQEQRSNVMMRRRRRRNNAEFLLEYIVAILKTVDLQGSAGQAEAMLTDFLGHEHARLFLHELRCWLRSPAPSLAAWDREVQYPDSSEPEPVEIPDPVLSAGARRRRNSRAGASSGVFPDEERELGEEEEDDGRRKSRRDWGGGDHWRPRGRPLNV